MGCPGLRGSRQPHQTRGQRRARIAIRVDCEVRSMSTTESGLVVPVSERDHALGPPDAPVSLVEYGDFECPYCAAATKAIEYLRRHLGDEMRFVFRHFPVTELHPHAEQAALATEAASAQGSFW